MNQPAPAMRMVTNLNSLGHRGNLEKENVLSLGIDGDILNSLEHLTESGTFRMITRNLAGAFQAFSQLNLPAFTVFDDAIPLNSLGTLTPPNPYLGVIPRSSRNSSIWIRT
jgi:hypothetical protein